MVEHGRIAEEATWRGRLITLANFNRIESASLPAIRQFVIARQLPAFLSPRDTLNIRHDLRETVPKVY